MFRYKQSNGLSFDRPIILFFLLVTLIIIVLHSCLAQELSSRYYLAIYPFSIGFAGYFLVWVAKFFRRQIVLAFLVVAILVAGNLIKSFRFRGATVEMFNEFNRLKHKYTESSRRSVVLDFSGQSARIIYYSNDIELIDCLELLAFLKQDLGNFGNEILNTYDKVFFFCKRKTQPMILEFVESRLTDLRYDIDVPIDNYILSSYDNTRMGELLNPYVEKNGLKSENELLKKFIFSPKRVVRDLHQQAWYSVLTNRGIGLDGIIALPAGWIINPNHGYVNTENSINIDVTKSLVSGGENYSLRLQSPQDRIGIYFDEFLPVGRQITGEFIYSCGSTDMLKIVAYLYDCDHKYIGTQVLKHAASVVGEDMLLVNHFEVSEFLAGSASFKLAIEFSGQILYLNRISLYTKESGL